jgi:hypothetical protein
MCSECFAKDLRPERGGVTRDVHACWPERRGEYMYNANKTLIRKEERVERIYKPQVVVVNLFHEAGSVVALST